MTTRLLCLIFFAPGASGLAFEALWPASLREDSVACFEWQGILNDTLWELFDPSESTIGLLHDVLIRSDLRAPAQLLEARPGELPCGLRLAVHDEDARVESFWRWMGAEFGVQPPGLELASVSRTNAARSR